MCIYYIYVYILYIIYIWMHPHFTGEFPPCPKKTQKRQALDPRGSEQIRLGNGLPCPQGTPRTQKNGGENHQQMGV